MVWTVFNRLGWCRVCQEQDVPVYGKRQICQSCLSGMASNFLLALMELQDPAKQIHFLESYGVRVHDSVKKCIA